MDDQTEWILERIGPIKQEVAMNKSYLTCGRMKDQDIVCLSLLVSREHCEFAQLQDGLSVIDFGSSNGVFVNGQQIRARQRHMLEENDYVGIGCCNIEDLDKSMFVYQVKKKKIPNDRLNRKQQSKTRQGPIPVPAKIQKLPIKEDDDDNDIEIIEHMSSDSAVIQSKKINPLEKLNAKEFRKIAHPIKQINDNVHLKPVVSECSSTSNIDNETGNLSKNCPKITEKDNSSKIIKSNNYKNSVSAKVLDIIEIDINDEPVPINIKIEPMQLDEVGTSSINTASQEVGTNSISVGTKQVVQNAQVDNCSPFVDDNAGIDTANLNNIKSESKYEDNNSHLPSMNDCNEELNIENDDVNNIKEELYSQIDLVDIGDEDDDCFPSSQLFNKSSIKEEIENNDYNEQMHLSQFLDEEDDNIITIIDSDEESNDEINDIDPLQQIKSEPVPESVVAEMIVPEILETDFNMEVDKLPSNNNEIVNSSTRVEIDHTLSCFTKESEVDTNNKKLPNNEGLHSSASNQLIGPFEKALQSSNELILSSSHDPLEPSTSKNVSSPFVKPIKKGVKIIEPHHMKPKKRGRSSDDKRYSSDLNSSFSRKNKKSKKYKSSSTSSKKSSHHSSSSSSGSSSKKKNSSKSSSKRKERHGSETTNDSIDQSVPSSEKPEEPEKPKNRTTIVKAKVSSKSRGDMLCESMINLRPTPRTVNKKVGSESAKNVPSKDIEKIATVVNSSCVIPRRQIPSGSIRIIGPHSEIQSSNSSNKHVLESSSESNSVSSSISRKENSSTVLKNTTNLMNFPSSSISNNAKSSPSDTESVGNDLDFPTDSPPLKPSLTIPVPNGNNKRVSFKENIVSVKEFSIDPGNSMRNIKDGLKTVKEFPKPLELKIEDFLARVFAWEPCWMEQQQKVKELPPIVDKRKLLPLPNTFNCFEQYYKRMEILLLLETWQLLLKEYECTGSKYSNSRTVCCAIERDSIKQQLTPNRLRYSKLDIKTITTKDELRLKSNPVYGDMIILEYTIKISGQIKWRRAFAYVVEVRQQNSLRSLPSAHPLFRRVNNPHAIITYTVQTRVIDEHTIQFEQLARLRSILYLRPHLRAIKGLQCVARSALRDSILHVDIDEYQLDQPNSSSNYPLITNDKLNEKQKEAVIKFTDAATNMKSKIGLLVGPPGTGKSTVITNLVTQMLYGDGRFVNGNAKRILVCAPSNAAIDEIVLRLLEIRQAISKREHRFRMVRIGREECMHEEVKKISVADLARKEANRLFTGNKQKHLEDVEHKKHLLLKTIKSLNDLMASDPHNRSRYEMELEHKRTKYEKLSHRSPEAEQMERSKLETNAKTTILHGAHVIACTLSSCYNGQMEAIFGGNTDHIATCIVDEATQCCEAETLIPLMLGVKNLILVGDPNQLPATVMSTDAKRLGLDRSLFTRAKEALESQLDNISDKDKDPVIMLKEQYRMVSAISFWPNKFFYKGKLIDRVAYKQSFPYHPYRILNVDGDQDQTKFSNTSEALFVGNLVHALMMCDKIPSFKKKISMGIITPYQNQRTKILETIRDQTRSVPPEIKNKFETECNTIDSFQGQERDVIIMSCVRSHGIGFLSDPQRLCVALTRAKHTLIICGNFAPFKKDKMWDDLLCDARSRGLVSNVNKNARPDEIKPLVVRLF
ncbi:probable helicase senataxin isoform X2 [Phymastichus coffea]|uniref:probable helicase senataxin isoform X2 n=1 Tax=Phymastichus coffea TaxID=108790 RepID=UPI00273C8340|nr:probable helicase senataxin isoform X2 [Phymastichus coffea]